MSTPRINPNDPKWTAYVLGELDEAEVQAVERLLEISPEARALIEELSSATNAIAAALATEPAPLLTTAQRAEIRSEADARPSHWSAFRPVRRGMAAAVAIAAGLLVAIAVQPTRLPTAPGAVTSLHRVETEAPAAANGVTLAPRVLTDRGRASGRRDNSATASAPPAVADASRQPDAGGTKARLTGSARDTSGTGLPGVTVTALNSANAVVGTTSTDALGRYSFDNLDSGEYKVTATLPGFRAASADLRADAGGRQQDFTMAVAGLGETITVAGQAPVLDSFRTARTEARPLTR